MFGSKRGIVDALLARVDAESTPQRAAALSTERGGGPRVDIDVLAELVSAFWTEHGPLVRLLRQGIGDPEIGNEWLRRQLGRREILMGLVAHWPTTALRRGVDVDTAADIAWSLSSHEQYELLVSVRGWSTERYVEWLRHVLRRELLARP